METGTSFLALIEDPPFFWGLAGGEQGGEEARLGRSEPEQGMSRGDTDLFPDVL